MVRTNLQEFVGDVHVLSNLQVGSNLFANDLAANVLTIAGNVAAEYFIGDGGFLSNIATTLDDIISNPNGNSVSNTVVFISGQDPIANTAIGSCPEMKTTVLETLFPLGLEMISSRVVAIFERKPPSPMKYSAATFPAMVNTFAARSFANRFDPTCKLLKTWISPTNSWRLLRTIY